MDINEILVWLVPMIAGALLAFLTSIITTKTTHKNQLESDEKKDQRKRTWDLEDRKQERQRIIFDEQIEGINSCLSHLTDAVHHISTLKAIIENGFEESIELYSEQLEQKSEKFSVAAKNREYFNIIEDIELFDDGREIFSVYNELNNWSDTIYLKKAITDIDSQHFQEIGKKFGRLRAKIIRRIAKLSKQYY